jgi:hypothetical protein
MGDHHSGEGRYSLSSDNANTNAGSHANPRSNRSAGSSSSTNTNTHRGGGIYSVAKTTHRMSLSAGTESASASTEHRLEGCSEMRMYNKRVHTNIGLLWRSVSECDR